jgi:hypothetical protein
LFSALVQKWKLVLSFLSLRLKIRSDGLSGEYNRGREEKIKKLSREGYKFNK